MDIAELYEEYESDLHRYALRLSHETTWADDLVQDTMIRAMGHLPLLAQLKKHQRRAWLKRTLKNRFVDEVRRNERHRQIMEMLDADNDYVASFQQKFQAEPSPFELVPEQYRELIHMRYALEMNSTEIGEELGIPAATVRSRLHLAMKELRRNKHRFS